VFARVTTFQARPGSIDEGIAFGRDEVMPLMNRIDGSIGLSILVDRDSGKCIATSAWETQDAMRNGDTQMEAIRDRAGKILGASPQVEEWEIGGLHRDHRTSEGACSRVSWMQGEPGQPERMVDTFKNVLPALEAWDGFCSASLLIHPSTGRAVVTTTWDSRSALEGSRSMADQARAKAANEMGGRIVEVAEFELAFAHLRVPELV
jgi:heme-degrading monooxygenase HmoA